MGNRWNSKERESELLLFDRQFCFLNHPVSVAFRAIAIGYFALVQHTLGAAEVVATRLDGTVVTGELRLWSNGRVVVGTPTGEKAITSEQLVSLHWPSPVTAERTHRAAPGLAELNDGSLLPVESFLVLGNQATLTLPAALGGDVTLRLSVKNLAAVRFTPLEADLAKQWDEIRRSKLSGDLLVVHSRDGKNLDYVDGVLGDITTDKVELKIEGESNRADRGKVAGVLYLRRPIAGNVEPQVTLLGRSGLRVAATDIEVKSSKVTITTPGGAKFDWPIDDLKMADFSHGKIMFLSDMDPVSSDWKPLIGLPEGISTIAMYGQFRRDQSAFGSALSVDAPDASGNDFQNNIRRTFNKGLAIRSRTELVYRLPDGFQRFTALAGIEPDTVSTGAVRIAISADDRSVLETEIIGSQAPVPIDVRIDGVKRLKLVVDYGKNQDTGDWLNLCDAKLLK